MSGDGAHLRPAGVVVVSASGAGTIVCIELANAGLRAVRVERGRRVDPRHDLALPQMHDELNRQCVTEKWRQRK